MDAEEEAVDMPHDPQSIVLATLSGPM